jgi:DNA-binding SARP family transcriptional activator
VLPCANLLRRAHLEFRILGPIEVRDAGRPLALGGAKQRAVLAILLLHANDLMSAEQVMEELWGETQPDTARNVLQVYVSQLRKLLEPGIAKGEAKVLVTRQPGYVLNVAPEDLDLTRAERLIERGRKALADMDPSLGARLFADALALWRGNPLADFTLEPFAQTEIERLEELRLSSREDLFEAELELGRGAQLVHELEADVATHPLRERLRAHLMLALYQAGRQAEALEAYRAGTDLLSEELGIDPGPALQSVHEAILKQDPSLSVSPAVPTPDGDVLQRPAVHERATVSVLVASGAAPVEADEWARLSDLIDRAGGTVIETRSDELHASFGFPALHEDATERAILVGLRAAIGLGEPIAIGIATDRLPAVELERTGGSSVLVGRAASLAGRLGEVVIDNETQRRVRSQFDLTDVEGGSTVSARPAATAAPASPLVGRDRELEVLGGLVDDLVGGRGHVLLVDGDTGLGKTRLLWELRVIAASRAHWFEGSCATLDVLGPYPALAAAVRTWAGVELGAEAEEIRAEIRRLLADTPVAEHLAGLVDSLEPLIDAERLAADVLPSSDELFDGLYRVITALSDAVPVVLAIDDVHEIDADTRAMIEMLLPLTDRIPLCVALTTRGDPRGEGWELVVRSRARYRHRLTDISLAALGADHAAALADALSPVGVLDQPTRDEIVARSGGSPLFLEQLMEELRLSGGLESRRGWTLSLTHAGTLLPPALEDLLAVRINRLPPDARALAQAAAVIGGNVTMGALARVTDFPPEDDSIAVLLRAEVLREAGRFPEPSYRFVHDALRDAALTTLTPERARTLFARAADSAEAEDQPDIERVANYRYRAQQWAEAFEALQVVATRTEGVSPAHAADLWRVAARAAERLGDDDASSSAQERAAGLLSSSRGSSWHPTHPAKPDSS